MAPIDTRAYWGGVSMRCMLLLFLFLLLLLLCLLSGETFDGVCDGFLGVLFLFLFLFLLVFWMDLFVCVCVCV